MLILIVNFCKLNQTKYAKHNILMAEETNQCINKLSEVLLILQSLDILVHTYIKCFKMLTSNKIIQLIIQIANTPCSSILKAPNHKIKHKYKENQRSSFV